MRRRSPLAPRHAREIDVGPGQTLSPKGDEDAGQKDGEGAGHADCLAGAGRVIPSGQSR